MLAFLLACATPEAEPAPGPVDDTPEAPEVSQTDEGTLTVTPDEDARPLKVMRIAHIKASMEQVSGVEWTVGGESGWDAYASTLGVPDLQTTQEELRTGASVMLQKFLDDAANATCTDWIAAEVAGVEAARFFVEADPEDTDADRIEANIVHLRWHITGRPRGEDDPIVADYVALFDLVLQRTGAPLDAWQTVCVGLFTHPDFYTY